MFIFLHLMLKLLNTHINILYYDQPDPKIYIHKKNKNPSTFYSFQLNIFTYFNREVKSKWQEWETLYCIPWYHCDSTFPLLLFLILFTFFLILNHAIFIIPFANHRWLCKHEKGVERRKKKFCGRRNENNHHYPFYHCCSYAKSIFRFPSILNPFILIFIHYFYSNIALEATKMHKKIIFPSF